jgi:hypothetical protein
VERAQAAAQQLDLSEADTRRLSHDPPPPAGVRPARVGRELPTRGPAARPSGLAAHDVVVWAPRPAGCNRRGARGPPARPVR